MPPDVSRPCCFVGATSRASRSQRAEHVSLPLTRRERMLYLRLASHVRRPVCYARRRDVHQLTHVCRTLRDRREPFSCRLCYGDVCLQTATCSRSPLADSDSGRLSRSCLVVVYRFCAPGIETARSTVCRAGARLLCSPHPPRVLHPHACTGPGRPLCAVTQPDSRKTADSSHSINCSFC